MTLERLANYGNIWPIVELNRSNQSELYDSRDVMSKPTSKLYVRVNLSVFNVREAISKLADRGITAKRSVCEESIYLECEEHHADLDAFENSRSRVVINPRAGEVALIGHNIMRSYLSLEPDLPQPITDPLPVVVHVGETVAASKKCYECYRRESEQDIEPLERPHEHVVALGTKNPRYYVEMSGPWKDPIIYNNLPRYKFPAISKRDIFEIQTLPSIITSRLLAPEPGQTVVDACAGPGRKSMHIAELMKRSGKLYAFEIDYRRKTLIRERARRFGIDLDNFMTVSTPDSSNERAIERILKDAKADSVLIDPPCSSLGTRPKIFEPALLDKWKSVHALHVQRNILKAMSRFLMKGGRIVYSTCTLDQAENEMQIERFLSEKEGEFVLEEPRIAGVDLKPYICKTEGQCKNKALKFLPKTHDSIGYFIAVLKKEE